MQLRLASLERQAGGGGGTGRRVAACQAVCSRTDTPGTNSTLQVRGEETFDLFSFSFPLLCPTFDVATGAPRHRTLFINTGHTHWPCP